MPILAEKANCRKSGRIFKMPDIRWNPTTFFLSIFSCFLYKIMKSLLLFSHKNELHLFFLHLYKLNFIYKKKIYIYFLLCYVRMFSMQLLFQPIVYSYCVMWCFNRLICDLGTGCQGKMMPMFYTSPCSSVFYLSKYFTKI